jgi:hypothetical protein
MRNLHSIIGAIAVILFCCSLSLIFPQVIEAAETLSMEVSAGFGGYARMGQAFPLQIMLENQGAEIQGNLEVSVSSEGSKFVQSKKVVLPQNSKKRVSMYIPKTDGNAFTVRLMSPDRKIAEKKARITSLQPQELVVGVLSSDPSTLNHLAALKIGNGNQRISVIKLQDKDIPENSLLLDNLDVLALNNFSSSTISKEQFAAIQSWVERGGLLVVAGGSTWQKTLSPVPGNLLPLKANGSMSIAALPELEKYAGNKLPAGSKFAISTGELTKGQPMVMDAAIPIIVLSDTGRGNVLYLGFDLAQEPFASWAGNEKLWWNILSTTDPHQLISAGNAVSEKYYGGPQRMSSLLRSIPASDLPDGNTLAIFLLGYVLILGPGVYLLLKKFDRRDLGWVAIPLLAVVLFTATYVWGFKLKGRDVFTNVISIVKLEPGFDYAEVNSSIGVFAPTVKDYTFKFQGEKLISVYPMNEYGYSGIRVIGGSIGTEEEKKPIATVFQDQDTSVKFGDDSRWSMRSVECRDIVSKPGEISAELKSSNGHIQGKVTNDTAMKLFDCVVLNAYGYQKIGEMAPGESVVIDLHPRINAANRGNSMFYRIFENYPVQRPEWYRQNNSRDEQISRQAMDVLYYSGELQASLVFFGRSAEAMDGLNIKDDRGMEYHSTLLVSPVELQMQSGNKISVPAGLINGRVVSIEGTNYHQEIMGYYLENGTIYFDLEIPFSMKNLEVDELKLLLGLEQNRNRGAKVEIYNLSHERWEEIACQPVAIPIENWREVISPAGEIKLRIGTANTKTPYIRVTGLSMTMEGHYLDRNSDSENSPTEENPGLKQQNTGNENDSVKGGD